MVLMKCSLPKALGLLPHTAICFQVAFLLLGIKFYDDFILFNFRKVDFFFGVLLFDLPV